MNREDIIYMAREAGFPEAILELSPTALERFAALVASAEHKRVQQVYTDAATGSVKAAIAYEREACAKICEETTASWTQHLYNEGCIDCAKAIRARGQA